MNAARADAPEKVVAALRQAAAPRLIVRYGSILGVLAAVLFVWACLHVQVATVTFVAGPTPGRVTIAAGRDAAVVADTYPVEIRAGARSVILRAADLAAVDAAAKPARAAVAQMLRDGPVTVRIGGLPPKTFLMQRRPATLADLPAAYWLDVSCGLVAMLFGFAIWMMQPWRWASTAFASAGVWLFASAAVAALANLWTPAADAAFVTFTLIANAATLQPFALSFVALFARFPAPLATTRTTVVALVATAAVALVTVVILPFVGDAPSTLLMMLEYLLLLVLLAVQLWVNRRRPAQRATLVILGLSIGLGVALYFLVTLLPSLTGQGPSAGEMVAFPLFILIYGGIGVSIVRTRLLAMDGWSRSILLSISFSAMVLLVDLALLHWLSRQQDVALGLAFAAVALVYLPIRDAIGRRTERRRSLQVQGALQFASDLTFIHDPVLRAERWRAALQAMFAPQDIAPLTDDPGEPAVVEDGLALAAPAFAGAPALLCRYPDGGRRLFASGDLEAIRALMSLTRQLIEARNAYLDGAAEERQRIARDLHDSVSGRLTASLRRRDVAAVQHDVRDAMTDLRSILNGLDGGDRPLGELLADLRHECFTRLQAVGVTLDWPMTPLFDSSRIVDARHGRDLTAVLRELVSNIIRHAQASAVTIDLTPAGEGLQIVVSDDGVGLPATHGAGRGLANCRERAKALGGAFDILPAARGAAARLRVGRLRA